MKNVHVTAYVSKKNFTRGPTCFALLRAEYAGSKAFRPMIIDHYLVTKTQRGARLPLPSTAARKIA